MGGEMNFEFLMQLLPFIITIMGGVAWLVRLEAKILNIEKKLYDDRSDIRSWLSRIDSKLDKIFETQSKQWTKIIVNESKIEELKDDE